MRSFKKIGWCAFVRDDLFEDQVDRRRMAQQAPDGSDNEVGYLALLGVTPERLAARSAPVLPFVPGAC